MKFTIIDKIDQKLIIFQYKLWLNIGGVIDLINYYNNAIYINLRILLYLFLLFKFYFFRISLK